MNPLILGPLLEMGGKLLERLFPDPAARAEAELEFMKMTYNGDLQTTIKQLEINAVEAAHPRIWVSGWRPFVGWGCGVGFLYSTVFYNLLSWLALAMGWPVPPPINTELLLYVLGGMLGIATLRTVEKKSGVTK